MDSPTTSLASAIGTRVRTERLARSWTLDHLAGVAGISRRMLINVEQGEANPSVGTLLRLSDALGIGLPALVEPPQTATLAVTRRGQGAALWTGDNGGRGVLMAGTEPPDVVELWDWTLAPGDKHDSEAHSTGTRELIQVQHGTISLAAAGQTVELSAGDGVAFPGDAPHSYRNEGTATARFSLAVFEPGVGSVSRPEVSHG